MDPRNGRLARQGALVGTLFAIPPIVEIFALNRETIHLGGAISLGVFLLSLSGALGAATGLLGGLGARAFFWNEEDGATSLAALVIGQLAFPLGLGAWAALSLLAGRLFRRRLFPRRTRLDLAVALGIALWITSGFEFPATSAAQAPARASPLPGSVAVTISVAHDPVLPEVATVRLPLQELRTEDPGRLAALWSGRAPIRTKVGTERPRRVAPGSVITHLPRRPLWKLAAQLLPPVGSEEACAALEREESILDIVERAGIPILRDLPAAGEPPLSLRILTDSPLDEPAARELQSRGAWIHVVLSPARESLSLSGEGIAVRPPASEATLMDVAPTALHLLGLPIPRDCDGRVLLEHLASPGPRSREPRYRSRASTKRAGSRALRTAVRKRGSLRTGSNLASRRKRSGSLGRAA